MKIEWIKEIVGNPYITLGLILLALLTFILMIIFYYRSKKIKKPLYSIMNINLIRNFDSKISSLKISLGEESIENLSISKIAFWNGGRETIRRNDIADRDPLIISLNEPYKIFDTKVLVANNPANNISISRAGDERSVLINFEYLDANEGCVMQIVHNGVSPEDLSVSGTIIGAGKPKKKDIPSGNGSVTLSPYGPVYSNITPRELGFILLIVGSLAVLAGIGFLIFGGAEGKSTATGFWITGVIFSIISLFLLPRKIPGELEKTFKDMK